MTKYHSVEIRPLKRRFEKTEGGYLESVEMCDPSEVEFWGLYLIDEDESDMHLGDVETLKEAVKAAEHLEKVLGLFGVETVGSIGYER